MRPSEFVAIRQHLQDALDRIDADLKGRQSLLNRLASLEGTPSKVKPRAATDEEKAGLSRSFRCTSLMQDAYPWRHVAIQAAVWLRKAGWATEADEIELVLSELPTGPVDGNQPEILSAQFDAIQAGAERIKTILTACLAGGPKEVEADGSATADAANENAKERKPSRKGIGGRKPLSADEEKKRLDVLSDWLQANEAGIDQKQFCRDKGIKRSTLRRYVNWYSTRQSRNTNSE